MTNRRSFFLLAAAAAAGCSASRQPSFDYGEAKNRYALKGQVLRLKSETRVAVIKHEKIEGWMEAMTMVFPVPSAGEFAKLKEGMNITATVEVSDLHYWLTGIKPE